jgi:hypothetical protein
MPPYRTQDDVSYQQYQHERAWPYIIPGHSPAFPAQSTHMATMEMRGPSHFPTPYRPVQPRLLPDYGSSGPHFIHNVNGTVIMVDQTISQHPIRPVDDLGNMEPGQNGHLGENGSHVGPRTEDALLTAPMDGCGSDSENLELMLAPYLEALQSQTDTLLAEGYGAGPDTQSCQLDARLLESINTIIGQSGDPLDEGNQPRSPTPSLTTEAASAEQTTTGPEFHHLHDRDEAGVFEPAPEMVEHPTLSWLEKNRSNRPLYSMSLGDSIPTRQLATEEAMALKTHQFAGMDRDGVELLSTSCMGTNHQHSGSAAARPGCHPTPSSNSSSGPDLEGFTLRSASPSAFLEDTVDTQHEKPSESTLPTIRLEPPEGDLNITPAHPPSLATRPGTNPERTTSGTPPILDSPFLALPLAPQSLVYPDQRYTRARLDGLPDWFKHVSALSNLAHFIKLRDPLPGTKHTQERAFMLVRCLFVEMFSFSVKTSFGEILGSVSRATGAYQNRMHND